MIEEKTDELMDFNFPTDPTKIIKVIGVGGGGVNAVNYMYNSGIKGVNFAVCNTDKQPFIGMNVPVKVTLGDGLGAGGDPEKAKEQFEKSRADVEKLLDDGTQMAFIASGLGGGTGSGAAPLLARMAKDKGILTVGIVTIPFLFEQVPRIIKALDAVDEMSKNVDALIVINNERLKSYYPDFELTEAFKKPDEVLAMAVKSIAEIITLRGIINRDFNDVKSTMKNGGVALVSYGFGKGESRLENAIREALESPLLSNNNIYNAKRVLFYISLRSDSHFLVEELSKHIDVFMGRFDRHIDVIWGYGVDDSLAPDQEVKFTIIATGFGVDDVKYEPVDDAVGQKMVEDKIQQDDRRNKEIERVKKQYDNFEAGRKVTRVSQSSIIVMTDSELDDDTLIAFMENNPTYSRDAKSIAGVRKPAKITAKNETPVLETESPKKQTFINF
ncbi:MAG: cell division FtsZ family protein [Tannerella sp.]|jgi:cell division protein FtsZ|nr:cell division FtsZ family protein [Tannerella sp.]